MFEPATKKQLDWIFNDWAWTIDKESVGFFSGKPDGAEVRREAFKVYKKVHGKEFDSQTATKIDAKNMISILEMTRIIMKGNKNE